MILVLSRQAMPTFDRQKFGAASGVARGAYVLVDAPEGHKPQVILMGSGSELGLCVQGWEALAKEGIHARVVSMPCWEQFELQDQAYQDSVLPPDIAPRVAVEQAATLGWERYVGRRGGIIGMHTFGASAPLKAPPDQIRLHAGAGRRSGQGTDQPPRRFEPQAGPPNNRARDFTP